MGRGSRPYETNVVKRRTIYPKSGAGGGGASQNNQPDTCLFSFSLAVEIKPSDNIRVELQDSVSLIPAPDEQVEILIGGIKVANYVGTFKNKLWNCMSDNYVYTGKIESITVNGGVQIVLVTISGHGR